MRLIKSIAIGSFILFLSRIAFAQDVFSIIPEPVRLTQSTGTFLFDTNVVIVASDKSLIDPGHLFGEQILLITGYPLKVVQAGSQYKRAIVLELNKRVDREIGNEGYRLSVKPETIIVKANSTAGIFYGMQTLVQLLPSTKEGLTQTACNLPAVEITDYPRFAWRGLMLDASRHFFPKEFVKKYIDQMVKYKYNVFHWHLTDDPGWRVEIKKYPKLTEVGSRRVARTGRWGSYEGPQPNEKASDTGFYTQDDIKEIVRYAAERNVTIVPEVDVPGHSAALIVAYPEVSCSGKEYEMYPGSKSGLGANVLCAGHEKSFELLDGIYKEIALLFPGQYVHVGGDEVNKGFWKNCENCQKRMKDEGLKDEHELQSYFIGRVSSILRKYNKKLIGWDEILEGGLANGAAVMSWRGPEGGIAAAGAGHYAVMSPLQFCYLDYQQTEMAIEQTGGGYVKLTDAYRFEPVPDGVDAKYILGGQANLWTEFVSTPGRAEYMTWPRAFAIAEVLWSPKKERDPARFIAKVEKHFSKFNTAGVNYSPAIFDPHIRSVKNFEGNIQIELATEAENVELFYSFDGTLPDRYAQKYMNKPVSIPQGASDIRVIGYRNGSQVGRILSLSTQDLRARAR